MPKEFTIVSSTAKRAAETAYLFCESLNIQKDRIIFNENLYTFDDIALENSIKSTNDQVENLILFGHNGAITDFVNKFGDKLIHNVPTAGLVCIKFDQNNWSNIQNGKTVHTIFPKEI